ncbi:MAG: dTMP kinase [Elusimicrobiota bacterium]|jgi:dTMP kinase|nr:dTMP kinase [Elusimicrobiota bacterium]
MKNKKGIFITVEGGEGAGKSTHSLFLKNYFDKQSFNTILTREPGGTKLAENIRRILLNPKSKVFPLSELFLYEAARVQHIQEIISPALKDKKIVICDRFTDATIAYQGYGRKIDLSIIEKLNEIASFGIKPDLTIYLDISPKFGLKRAKILNKDSYGLSGDRIERESALFHKNVRKGYLEQSKKEPKRIKVVKVKETPEQTQAIIREIIKKCLIMY